MWLSLACSSKLRREKKYQAFLDTLFSSVFVKVSVKYVCPPALTNPGEAYYTKHVTKIILKTLNRSFGFLWCEIVPGQIVAEVGKCGTVGCHITGLIGNSDCLVISYKCNQDRKRNMILFKTSNMLFILNRKFPHCSSIL